MIRALDLVNISGETDEQVEYASGMQIDMYVVAQPMHCRIGERDQLEQADGRSYMERGSV